MTKALQTWRVKGEGLQGMRCRGYQERFASLVAWQSRLRPREGGPAVSSCIAELAFPRQTNRAPIRTRSHAADRVRAPRARRETSAMPT